MRKLLVVSWFIIVLLTVLSFSGAPALADDHTYDEQEAVFHVEANICTVIRTMARALGTPDNRLQDCRIPPGDNSADLPHKWIAGWKHTDHWNAHGGRYQTWLEFTDIYYTDGESRTLNVQTSQPQVVKGEGWSNLYEAGDESIDQEVTVTMELQEEKSSSYDVGVSFSVTNRTKVSASGGVPGVGEASAENETEVTAGATFGLNSAKSTATTETYSETTTIHIPANTKIHVTADKVRYTEIRTVQENAYLDFGFKVNLYKWVCPNEHYLCHGESYRPLHFDNIKDFCDFVEGHHPREHPNMHSFLSDAQKGKTHWAGHVVSAHKWLCIDKKNRQVHLIRTDKRVYDNVTQIRTEKAA